MMLIGDRNHRLVEAQAPTASSSSAAPSDVTAIGAAVDDEPSSSATSTRESTPTSSGSTKNAMEQRHPASSRSRVQRPTTTTSSRRKPTSFANIVIASLAIVYITICGHSSQAALLQGCNFDESLCDQGEICIPDGLFGQCYSDEESELLKPLVVDRPLDAFQQELLRLELTRLANNALNWPHARSQCVLAYFKLTVVYALDYDTEFCSARNPNNIWALIQEVQNVLATEREEAAKQELLRQTFLHNGVQVVGNDNVAAASDNSELSGGDNAEDFRAIFLKLRQPVGDAVAEEETADGAAEEPPLTNADDGAGNGEEQQQQQLLLLQQRQVKRSIDGNDDEDQQQQQQQQKQLFENQQMPVALEEDVDGSAAVIPQRVVELDTRDGQPVPASVDVSAKPTTPLSVELPTLDDAARNAIPQLEKADEQSVDAYVDDVLHNREPHLRALNERQFQKLAVFVNQMRDILLSAVDSAAIKALNSENDGADVGGAADPANNDSVSAPEVEEVVPLTSANNQQQLLLKKDAETFHNDDMGLSKTVHKIVKGGVERVEGDRVYLKVLDDKSLDETELYRLINYLDRQIAQPNQLYFDEFKYADGQLSFRISRLRFVNDLNQLFSDAAQSDDDEAAVAAKETDAKEGGGGGKQPPIIDNASGVAEAVYKRRKDIQTLSGVEVDETGIGSGENIVPVESAKHEWFFVPVVAVCAFTILSLIGVLAVQLFRRDGRARCGRGAGGGAGGGADDASSRIAKALQNANLPEVIDHYEGKPSSIYQDLCRQRMLASQDMPVGVSVVGGERRATLSKHSSTSSWPDESVLQSSNLDISTGHVIMAFLKEYLEKPDEIAAQWGQLSGYENANACTSIGARAENASKNLDGSVLPYDDSLVTLQQPQHNNNNNTADATIVTVTTDAEAPRYVNASRIYDADPRQVAYIAAQSPCAESVVDFWQMVWEQGVVLVVNLCEASELRDHASRMAKYWPDEGAKVFGTFEINLVSEHIWSEDYVVRSLYLKNLATRETRTVTQFHYLTWPAGGVPHSIKSLLEFRRKVNKSYRGHASPVLIHCTNGSGRTGTYCLIDVVMNRILKGIKELNVAGSLEHLRDQRAKMVENQAQYTFVFQCVAEEVSSLLKNLQH